MTAANREIRLAVVVLESPAVVLRSIVDEPEHRLPFSSRDCSGGSRGIHGPEADARNLGPSGTGLSSVRRRGPRLKPVLVARDFRGMNAPAPSNHSPRPRRRGAFLKKNVTGMRHTECCQGSVFRVEDVLEAVRRKIVGAVKKTIRPSMRRGSPACRWKWTREARPSPRLRSRCAESAESSDRSR